MNKADYDLIQHALLQEHGHATRFGSRADVQRVEHTVLAIAGALAGQSRAFRPVAWILDACGARNVSQLTAPARRDLEETFGTTRREVAILPGDRSKQAHALAAAFAVRIGASKHDVGARYVNQLTGYEISWANGPTWEQARALLDELLATARYPALAGTHLTLYRTCGSRAWAARAVAAVRENEAGLREQVAHRVSERNKFDRLLEPNPQRDARDALDEYVRELIDSTEHPERASNPADEPIIGRLLAAGKNSDSNMAALVLAKDPMVFAGEVPDGVAVLYPHRDSRGSGTDSE